MTPEKDAQPSAKDEPPLVPLGGVPRENVTPDPHLETRHQSSADA